MTAPELRDEIRKTLGFPDSFVDLSDPVIDRLTDEGFAVLANNLIPGRLMSAISVPLSAGVDAYVITGQPKRVIACNLAGVFLQPYTLTRLEREAPTWSTAANATPSKYWLEGVEDATGNPKIRLYPKPTSGTLTVSVLQRPRTLSSWGSGEVAQWDELAQFAVIFFAAWRFGCNGKVIVDPGKQQGFMDGFKMYQDMLRSYEDPTSAQAQQSIVEKGWRPAQ